MNRYLILNKNIIGYWSILWAVFASGSLYFQYQRMPLTIVILVVTICVMMYTYKVVSRRNMIRALIIISIGAINYFLTFSNGINMNDIIIIFVELVFLVLLQSNMTLQEFKQKYVEIIVLEAVISLICFLWADILGKTLPFQHWETGTVGSFNLTFYYTIGWGNIPKLGRNAGIFNEPGSHQIFLNFAILFLVSDVEQLGFKKKKYIISMIVLVLSVLTTQSTTGYMCLILVLLSVQFMKNDGKALYGERKWLKYGSLLLLGIVFLIENTTHVISYKLEGGGSYNTRYNDTFSGLAVALTKPLTGYGIYRSNRADAYADYGIGNISNGFISFAIGAGIIIALLYLIFSFIGLSRQFKHGLVHSILIFIFFFLCINSEGGLLRPLYLILFFLWKDEALSNDDGVLTDQN